MSLNSLLESANPYHSVQSDAARLSSKWEKTGLLEGIKGAHKTNMGIILENQAKQLVVESSQSGGGVAGASFATGTGEQWAGVALPLVRKVFGQIAAQEFVSVQPMNLPSGLVFYLDFQYGTGKSGQAKDGSLYGTVEGFASNDTSGGLYGAGRFGYSINTQTVVTASLTGVPTTASWSDLNFDSEYSASAVGNLYRVLEVADSVLVNLDTEAVRGFQLKLSTADVQVSAFTRRNPADTATLFIAKGVDVDQKDLNVEYSLQPTDQFRGDFEDGNDGLSPKAAAITIPEINVQMKSSAIVAKTRGQWFQTLGTKIQKLSNIIHQKTLRGGANFMVLAPSVSTIIESIPGFAGDVDGDVEKSSYAFGVQKMGSIGGGKIKVYKNPYMTENQILLGFRGSQFLESGAVFAPYIPLIMTPLVYDPDSFTPRKGLLTRYAKKMVRPEFYGKIKVNGLNLI